LKADGWESWGESYAKALLITGSGGYRSVVSNENPDRRREARYVDFSPNFDQQSLLKSGN